MEGGIREAVIYFPEHKNPWFNPLPEIPGLAAYGGMTGDEKLRGVISASGRLHQ